MGRGNSLGERTWKHRHSWVLNVSAVREEHKEKRSPGHGGRRLLWPHPCGPGLPQASLTPAHWSLKEGDAYANVFPCNVSLSSRYSESEAWAQVSAAISRAPVYLKGRTWEEADGATQTTHREDIAAESTSVTTGPTSLCPHPSRFAASVGFLHL